MPMHSRQEQSCPCTMMVLMVGTATEVLMVVLMAVSEMVAVEPVAAATGEAAMAVVVDPRA